MFEELIQFHRVLQNTRSEAYSRGSLQRVDKKNYSCRRSKRVWRSREADVRADGATSPRLFLDARSSQSLTDKYSLKPNISPHPTPSSCLIHQTPCATFHRNFCEFCIKLVTFTLERARVCYMVHDVTLVSSSAVALAFYAFTDRQFFSPSGFNFFK